MSSQPYVVTTEFDVPATMRDGIVLRANISRPRDDANTFPVLLMRLPYGKDFPLGSSLIDPVQIARRGYIVVTQDVRGRFTSEGDFVPFADEGVDGAETVAWAAQLPGANGVVGMYGGSYMGLTQWAAARMRPPALKAIAPLITWADPDDGVYTRGGALELGTTASWTLQMGIDRLMRRHGADVQALGRAIAQLAHEFDHLPTSGYFELPLERFGPLARLGIDDAMTKGVQLQGDPEFSAPARHTSSYADIPLPALHIAGWYDVFLNGTLRNFTEMTAAGHSGQTLLIGPWTHGVFGHTVGDVDFGFASSGALIDLRIDLVTLHMQFFDRWLKGAHDKVFDTQAPVKYFVMGANVWRSSATWPPEGATEVAWYLHSGGRANSSGGDGLLSLEAANAESPDHYDYDPARPVPTIGGATLLHPLLRAGPRDQSPIEQRPDVLVYTSSPLERALEVTGPVRVTLSVGTDAPDTDFVARLVDVRPDGVALPITDGILRMRSRVGGAAPGEPLRPDAISKIEIDLWATSTVFLPGHRIRLDITSSNFPRWDRNLNTGVSGAVSTEMRVARQAIFHDTAHQSALLLTIMPQP